MNPKLLAARRKFKGQKVTMENAGGFDNSPFAVGVHTFEVMESMVKEVQRKGETVPVHYLRLKCIAGDDEGKGAFPFGPRLDDIDGIVAAAKNIRAILGDVIPGKMNTSGGFEVDIPAFLDELEDLTAPCVGELVEVKVVNAKARADGKHLKDDGTPWQSFYIQRGLGDDKKGALDRASLRANKVDPDDDLNMANTTPPTRKTATKKKVAPKKKVARKKR